MSVERFLMITRESWELFKRMFARSVALALLTAIALMLVDQLVESGISDRFAIVRRFPEFIPFMMAAAKLTFIEMSVFWVHFLTAPRIEVQEALVTANTSPMGAALVHFTNALVWAFRVAVFLYLVG